LIAWLRLPILDTEKRANRDSGIFCLEKQVEPASFLGLSLALVERQGDGHPLIGDAGFTSEGNPDMDPGLT
jgi:hypothetical protein